MADALRLGLEKQVPTAQSLLAEAVAEALAASRQSRAPGSSAVTALAFLPRSF